MESNAVETKFSTLEILYDHVCLAVEKAQPTDSEEIERSEGKLARHASREWNQRVTSGLKKAASVLGSASQKPFAGQDVEAVLRIFDNELSSLDDAVAKMSNDTINRSYQAARERFIRKYRARLQRQRKPKRLSPYERLFLTKDDQDDGGGFALTSTDREAITNLTRLHLVAVGDHFPRTLKPGLAEAMGEIVERGLPKREAAQFVMDELGRKLGGFLEAVPASIRRQGQEATRHYFEGLAATTLTRARGFGALTLMNDAGIVNYRWLSIVDNRTSEICLAMDGRIFPVELGQDQMRRILEQDTADGLIETAGWRKDLSEFDLARGQRLDSFDVANLLSAQGVPIIPPAHYRCRSELIPA
jgi:SPP1 gp7 family putative phage head morphogenesis protein